jgi:hypothetical protein
VAVKTVDLREQWTVCIPLEAASHYMKNGT